MEHEPNSPHFEPAHPTRPPRRRLLALGGGLLVLGIMVSGCSAPDQGQQSASTTTRNFTKTLPSPTEEPLAGQECTVEADTRSQGDTEYVCTPEDNGDLVWMDKDSSEKLLEERQLAEAQRQAEEEAAARQEAERQAAEEAAAREEAERQAAEEAAVREEAERRAAEEAAAREEAERQAAAREEAQRQAEVTRQQQPADDFTYPNCTAVKEAGAAPIHPGDYGWHSGLDRDGDGVGCE